MQLEFERTVLLLQLKRIFCRPFDCWQQVALMDLFEYFMQLGERLFVDFFLGKVAFSYQRLGYVVHALPKMNQLKHFNDSYAMLTAPVEMLGDVSVQSLDIVVVLEQIVTSDRSIFGCEVPVDGLAHLAHGSLERKFCHFS